MSDTSAAIQLRRGAWDEDGETYLHVPDHWRVTDLRLAISPPLGSRQISEALERPVGGPLLRELASGKKDIGVIIDDLTRPTRADELLGPLLEHLAAAEVTREHLTLFIACGSHEGPPPADVARKAGVSLAMFRRVVIHDCHAACVDLGKTRHGTPVSINASLMACDLRIGVGSVFPHPAAAFSGGTKLLAPGMCGAATIRHLHDHLRPARARGGPLDSDIRREMNEIAGMGGLASVILAVPGADRHAVACVAGHPESALEYAAHLYRPLASVSLPAREEIDAVIVDAYPFDGTLQFAHDRALWPLKDLPAEMPVVLIAKCQRGAGTHEFFPAADPFTERVVRRVRQVNTNDLRRIPEILANALALRAERKRRIIIMAEGVGEEEVRRVFPRGTLCPTWEAACALIDERVRAATRRIVFYSTAPLLLPLEKGTSPDAP